VGPNFDIYVFIYSPTMCIITIIIMLFLNIRHFSFQIKLNEIEKTDMLV
jgi:hypothetical protein